MERSSLSKGHLDALYRLKNFPKKTAEHMPALTGFGMRFQPKKFKKGKRTKCKALFLSPGEAQAHAVVALTR